MHQCPEAGPDVGEEAKLRWGAHSERALPRVTDFMELMG